MLEDIKYSTLKDIKLLGALELTWASRMPVQSICPEGQGLPNSEAPLWNQSPRPAKGWIKQGETWHHCSLHAGRPCPALLSQAALFTLWLHPSTLPLVHYFSHNRSLNSQGHFCLRNLALAVPSAWRPLFLVIDRAYSFISCRCWLKCHLLSDAF